jgi:hypothetical protein
MGKQISSFNIELLENPTPIFSYVLGLLWADGYLSRPPQKRIAIEMVEEDMSILQHYFQKTGRWLVNRRHRLRRKPTLTLGVSNSELYDFLFKHDYFIKKSVSADEILNHIGASNVPYWLMGLIDGDGNVKTSRQTLAVRQGRNWLSFKVTFYSNVNQDWSYLSKICDNLNITYSIVQRDRNSGSSSEFRLVGKMAKNFCDFVYADGQTLTPLARKFSEYQKYRNYLSSKSL